MLALVGVVLVSAATATGPQLELRLTSAQTDVLVGEPLRVHVLWTATADNASYAVEDNAFEWGTLALAINDGKVERLYREYRRQQGELLITAPRKRGQEEESDLIFFVGRDYQGPGRDRSLGSFGYERSATDTVVFPQPGKYSVRAVYMDDGVPTGVRSNALRLSVREPSEADRGVLKTLLAVPRRFYAAADFDLVRQLVNEHPQNPYLRYTRATVIAVQADRLGVGRDPDTDEPLENSSAAIRREFRKRKYRELAEQALALEKGGLYRDIALSVAEDCASQAEDVPLRESIQYELLSHFPNSPTVKWMREQRRLLPEVLKKMREDPGGR